MDIDDDDLLPVPLTDAQRARFEAAAERGLAARRTVMTARAIIRRWQDHRS